MTVARGGGRIVGRRVQRGAEQVHRVFACVCVMMMVMRMMMPKDWEVFKHASGHYDN